MKFSQVIPLAGLAMANPIPQATSPASQLSSRWTPVVCPTQPPGCYEPDLRTAVDKYRAMGQLAVSAVVDWVRIYELRGCGVWVKTRMGVETASSWAVDVADGLFTVASCAAEYEDSRMNGKSTANGNGDLELYFGTCHPEGACV